MTFYSPTQTRLSQHHKKGGGGDCGALAQAVQTAHFISKAGSVKPCAKQINRSKPAFVSLFVFLLCICADQNMPVPSRLQGGKRFPMVLLGSSFHVEMVSGSL